jgi:hypothetical protein
VKSNALIILILTLSISSLAFSQEKNYRKEKVSFGGKARIGIDFRAVGGLGGNAVNDSRLTRIGIVETELKVRPADNVEVEFDLEFDYRFADVNLQKLFVRYNFDNSNVRLGFIKKMFSLEEIKSRKNRLFSKKSMLNDILEDFYLLGHDFTAQYRHNFPSSHTLIGGYAADGSNRHFVNLTLLGGKTEKTRFAVAGMYQNYQEEGGSGKRKNALFGNFGIMFNGKITSFELEGVLGTNPEQHISVGRDYRLRYNGDSGGFGGFRFQESFPFEINRKHLNKIVPLYEISYFNDALSWKTAYWQTRAGLNFCFTSRNRLQWRTSVDLILTANNQISNVPQIVRQRAASEIFVFW